MRCFSAVSGVVFFEPTPDDTNLLNFDFRYWRILRIDTATDLHPEPALRFNSTKVEFLF